MKIHQKCPREFILRKCPLEYVHFEKKASTRIHCPREVSIPYLYQIDKTQYVVQLEQGTQREKL